MKNIEDLLHKIALHNKYEAKAKDNEDKFNIFRICGVNHYENTHSAIIAELLNNNGTHTFKNKFLEAFLEVLSDEAGSKSDKNFEFSLADVNVETEYSTLFGRIDILIMNNYQGIIIENKIYADDQFEQLKRYSRFAKEKFNMQFKMYYLTLWGNEASEDSGKDVDYVQISYCDTIIKWLEKCVAIAARVPTVRETLIQYINHIKHLTANNTDMNEDVINLLIQPENLEATFTISENYNHVRNHIINKIFLPQLTTVCDDLGLINESTVYDRVTTSWAGFTVKKRDWKYFKIGFEFEARGLKNFIVGINHLNVENRNDDVFNYLKAKFAKKNNNWVWSGFPKYTNWDKDAMIAIQNGEMVSLFKIEIEKLLQITSGLEM